MARICEDHGLLPETGPELCVVEALTNVIRHVYRGTPGRPVVTRLAVLPDRIEIRVLDEGLPVPEDRRVVREPVIDPGDPLSIPEGGRGLYLIHRLMDGVAFCTEGGRNVLLMTKRWPPGRGPGPA